MCIFHYTIIFFLHLRHESCPIALARTISLISVHCGLSCTRDSWMTSIIVYSEFKG